ncbi:hypothetical protein ACFX11_015020 [Malus domestica]
MHRDANELVQKCDRCQCYKSVPTLPASELHSQTNPWPLMQWVIDLVGPMSLVTKGKGRGNRLLYQMGRSKAQDYHDSDRHRALHMEEHHSPIWHPLVHHRQWPAICGQRRGEVLPKVWHKAAHVNAEISSRQ